MSNPKLFALIGGIGLGVVGLYRWFGSSSAESSPPPPPEPTLPAYAPPAPTAKTLDQLRREQQYRQQQNYGYRFRK